MENLLINCPKCGAELPLTDAVSHKLRQELEQQYEARLREQNAAIARRELDLLAQAKALADREATVETTVALKLKAERAKLQQLASQEAREAVQSQLADLQRNLESQRQYLAQVREAEVAWFKERAELLDARDRVKLEAARQLHEERERIQSAARQQVLDEQRLALADRENKIQDLQKQIADLQRRATQGSMQAQGETLELALESDLRCAFPNDEIQEVRRGKLGTDVTQLVRAGGGAECGLIVWEAKRARNWSHEWIARLKQNQRDAKADCAILVTTITPEGLRGFGLREGVWVCEPQFACAVAAALRHGMINLAATKNQEVNSASKKDQLYAYLCGVEFRQHIEGMVDAFKGLQQQLLSEQAAFARQWREREGQIRQALIHAAQLYGGIQGIAGRSSLPEIHALEIPSAASTSTPTALCI